MIKPKFVVIAGLVILAIFVTLTLYRRSSLPGSSPIPNMPATASNNQTASPVPAESAKDRDEMARKNEEKLQAQIQQDLDEIREAVARQNPEKLVEKLQSADTGVRKEAVFGLRSLNYTNAIPELQTALVNTEDIREKIAILETIEYLQLPDSNFEEQTNSGPGIGPQMPASSSTN